MDLPLLSLKGAERNILDGPVIYPVLRQFELQICRDCYFTTAHTEQCDREHLRS